MVQTIAETSKSKVVFLSAVNAGVKEIREQIQYSENNWLDENKNKLIIFMDEIHRLSRNQQDVLLPAIEKGSIRFIGATTENPSFTVNNALISRSLVFQLSLHTEQDLINILLRASSIYCQENSKTINVKQEALECIAKASLGDARRSLNILETILEAKEDGDDVDKDELTKLTIDIPHKFDRNAEQHYNIISALIKSIRASKVDAALYYLARLIESGEDSNFIMRRLIISASEDIGNANPHALSFTVAASHAVQMLGMPEARIIMSQIVCFLSHSPKSNASYKAIGLALKHVQSSGDKEVPLYLRNATSQLTEQMGYGKEYHNPHNSSATRSQQSYFPEGLEKTRYYYPGKLGYEKTFTKILLFIAILHLRKGLS